MPDAEPSRCSLCAAPLEDHRCPVCAGDPDNLPTGFRLRCTRCGYDLQGNETGVCPECGGPATTWHLLHHYRKLEAARRARAATTRGLAETLLGVLVVIVAAVPTMPFGWPFTVLQAVIVCVAVGFWWRHDRRRADFEPGACLAVLLIPFGVTCFLAVVTIGQAPARWPLVSAISAAPGVAAVVVGLFHNAWKTLAIVCFMLAAPPAFVGTVSLGAGVSAAREGARYTDFERPWDLTRRPTLMTVSEAYTVAAVTLPTAVLLSAVGGVCVLKLHRRRWSTPVRRIRGREADAPNLPPRPLG